MSTKAIYKSNGSYLGFIKDTFLFSRDGLPLGWIENKLVWDSNGNFRGIIFESVGNNYIVKPRFVMPPIPRPPKPIPSIPALPAPQANIPPIILPTEFSDAF